MNNILIELDKRDADFYTPFAQELRNYSTEIEASRFDGVLVLQILAALNTVTLPLIAKLVSESIRAKRYVVVKKKGIEIKGLNASDVISVLRELKEDD